MKDFRFDVYFEKNTCEPTDEAKIRIKKYISDFCYFLKSQGIKSIQIYPKKGGSNEFKDFTRV